MRTRYQRSRRRKIGQWPKDFESSEAIASKVKYVGSAEHKDHPSPAGPPRLRSDATPCAKEMTIDVARNTRALREGIRRRCISACPFEGGFPKYVWTWIDGVLYEARHINGPQGTYKGYRIEDLERPDDPEGKLAIWELL